MTERQMSREIESAALVDWIKDKKISTWEHLRHLSRLSPEERKHYGFTGPDSFWQIITRSATEIERRIVAFERKYPDRD